jgi:sortase (surface protein transpeptidase)
MLYLLYKLIFDFIIPVYNTTKQVKKQFGDMQSKMQEHMQANQPQNNTYNSNTQEPPKAKNGDYIDFEEVKQAL